MFLEKDSESFLYTYFGMYFCNGCENGIIQSNIGRRYKMRCFSSEDASMDEYEFKRKLLIAAH